MSVVRFCSFVCFILGGASTSWAALEFDKPTQSFEANSIDGSLTAQFTFKNTGEAAIEITKVNTSCGCTAAALAQKVYQPGQTGSISATFNFGERFGPQQKILSVETTDPAAPRHSLTLNVHIHRPFSIEPQTVVWNQNEPRAAKTFDVTFDPQFHFHLQDVRSSNADVKLEIQPTDSTNHVKVSVTPPSTNLLESVSAPVEIVAEGPAGKVHRSVVHLITFAAPPPPQPPSQP